MSVHRHTHLSDTPPCLSHAPACGVEVLVLSRDGALASDVESALAGACVIQHAREAAVAIDVLAESQAGVLVTDAPGDGAAFQILARRLGQQFPHLVIVGVGDHATAVSLIDLFNARLVDRILLKPLSVDQVRQQVLSAMRQHLQSRGVDGNVPAALVEPPDWEQDQTEPQLDEGYAESQPDVSAAIPLSRASLALPALWRAMPWPAAKGASRRPFLIGGDTARALIATLALALVLGGSEETGRRGLPGAHSAPAVTAAPAASTSEVQRALAVASLALRQGRYVPPAEDNALDQYLAVLEIDPNHSQANVGLDTVVGVLLQQAQTALSENAIEDALARHRLARGLRPRHPAIPYVDAEFADYGRSLISDMRPALARGDLAGAGQQLDLAERFLPPGSPDVAVARARLAERRDRLAIDDRLALVFERMEANNLTIPENDSARFHLLALRADYPEDEKIIGALDRLVDKLLERTDEAILNGSFAAAASLLNKADELGAPSAALIPRREALAGITRQKAAAEALSIAEAALTEASLREELAIAEAALEVEALLAAPAGKPEDAEPLTAVSREPVQVASTTQIDIGSAAGAGAAVDAGSVEISELEILRMVEPEYPRRAWVRDIDGWIDLEFIVTGMGRTRSIEVTDARARGWFEQAAINAVEQWQFRPELENGQPVERRARVRLQFKKD